MAGDVVGRAGALLAQVTCSQQLAQVRHSWELEPQGKCSRWLGGWRCGRQAGRLARHHPYPHTLYAKLMNAGEKWKAHEYFHRQRTELVIAVICACAATWILGTKQTDMQRKRRVTLLHHSCTVFSVCVHMFCFGLSSPCGSVLAFSQPGGSFPAAAVG